MLHACLSTPQHNTIYTVITIERCSFLNFELKMITIPFPCLLFLILIGKTSYIFIQSSFYCSTYFRRNAIENVMYQILMKASLSSEVFLLPKPSKPKHKEAMKAGMRSKFSFLFGIKPCNLVHH